MFRWAPESRLFPRKKIYKCTNIFAAILSLKNEFKTNKYVLYIPFASLSCVQSGNKRQIKQKFIYNLVCVLQRLCNFHFTFPLGVNWIFLFFPFAAIVVVFRYFAGRTKFVGKKEACFLWFWFNFRIVENHYLKNGEWIFVWRIIIVFSKVSVFGHMWHWL